MSLTQRALPWVLAGLLALPSHPEREDVAGERTRLTKSRRESQPHMP